jgi:hypothetical protein
MFLHLVGFAIDQYVIIQTAAHHRKKDRSMPEPILRISLPDMLDIVLLVKKGGQLSALVTYSDPDIIILRTDF